MLVLSRKIGETIDIGDGLATICVADIVGDKVRIGITAPRELAVHRGEVIARIKDAKPDGDGPAPKEAA